MSQDHINQDAINSPTASREQLEQNLIHALTRLQHIAFDNAFLTEKAERVEELPPEPFLGIVIGHYNFMVPANCFCEVFVDTAIAALPNAPECLAGLSNIRGVLMPIYQLHSSLKFKLPKKTTIFCIGKGDAAVGILVDELPISLSLSAQQRNPGVECKDAMLLPLIQAAYLFNQRVWFLLNGHGFGEQLKNLAIQTHKLASFARNTHDLAYSENAYL